MLKCFYGFKFSHIYIFKPKGWIMEEETKQISEEECQEEYFLMDYFFERDRLQTKRQKKPTLEYTAFEALNKEAVELIFNNDAHYSEIVRLAFNSALADIFKKHPVSAYSEEELNAGIFVNYPTVYMDFIKEDILKPGGEYNTSEIEAAKRKFLIAVSNNPEQYQNTDYAHNWLAKRITYRYKVYNGDKDAPESLDKETKTEIYNSTLQYMPRIIEHFAKEKAHIREAHIECLEGMKAVPKASIRPLAQIKSTRTTLTTSKAARSQSQIAQWGDGGAKIIIDKKKHTLIEAMILPVGTELSCFERELQDAIGSLHQLSLNELVKSKGEKEISGWTLGQIYREFTGLTEKEKIHPRQEQQVKDAIEKMRKIEAEINFKSQATSHKNLKLKPDEAFISGPLVAADYVFINAGGHIKEGYRFTRAPLFYEYSKKIKQIATIDKSLLNTNLSAITHKVEGDKKTRNNSDTFILVKRWTLKQVTHMRSQKGFDEPRRSYQGLFEWLGINPTEKQARTIKADLDYYLKYLKAKKEITDFTKYKVGNAYAGVEIFL